jgi:hypothetical protein
MPPFPTAARIPTEALDQLASLRNQPFPRVFVSGSTTWLCWPAHHPALEIRLMAIPGAVLFIKEADGLWRPIGQRIPSFDVPFNVAKFIPLANVLIPSHVDVIEAPRVGPAVVTVGLDPACTPRPATALLCAARRLSDWVMGTPSFVFARLSVAVLDDDVLIRGRASDLPVVVSGRRFWGGRVLLPLGFVVTPRLEEKTLLRLLESQAPGEVESVWIADDQGRFEPIALDQFEPWSRASARLTIGGPLLSTGEEAI